MSRLFHVTSSRNRASIDAHGLDWQRMGAARGIAGSTRPEADGIFVSPSEDEVDFFVRINNTGTPVDIWAIDGIDTELIDNGCGFSYVPHPIPRAALTLVRSDIPPHPEPAPSTTADDALTSELTITFDS